MKELTIKDLYLVVTRMPHDIRSLVKKKGLAVGGGFIRETISGGTVNDIDLFGDDHSTLKKAAKELDKKRGGRKFETDNAITVLSTGRMPVQFITRWLFDDLESCVSSFDFTVCQAGVAYDADDKKWVSCVHDDFYSDLAAKRLVYTYPIRKEEAGGSMMRMVKFLRRGYNIQTQSIAGVMSRVAAKLKSSCLNDEQATSQVFQGLLVEVDPLEIIDGIDMVTNEHIDLDGAGVN
jgi:hypothetical protein